MLIQACIGIAGCGGEFVGVEPEEGFSTHVITGPVESDLPAVQIPPVVVWQSEVVSPIELPASVPAGSMLHFEGKLNNPHFPNTAFVHVRISTPPPDEKVVESDIGTTGPREREGQPVRNADLERDEYRLAVRAPREAGVYEVELSYSAFPAGTTAEMFPDPPPDGHEFPLQESLIFAAGELTVVASVETPQ